MMACKVSLLLLKMFVLRSSVLDQMMSAIQLLNKVILKARSREGLRLSEPISAGDVQNPGVKLE